MNIEQEIINAKHPVRTDEVDSIRIDGFKGLQAEKCFCVVAEGTRYHEYGIASGSVLLCKRAEPINNGDLVVVNEDGVLTVYLYLKDQKKKTDGEKRILHNKSMVYAKVLGSFNFYQ